MAHAIRRTYQLPPPLLSSLYAATVVGATAMLVRLAPPTHLTWLMYFYLVAYRTKIFLDDLVYYEELKGYALTRYEPAFAVLSWVLWIASALTLERPGVYFTLVGANFLWGIFWIFAASKNADEAGRSEAITKEMASSISRSHTRWLLLNVPPVIAGLSYGIAILNGAQADKWFLSWWIPSLLLGFFVVDLRLGWKYMFKLE